MKTGPAKLSPSLKAAADRLYQSDRGRYARIAAWINAMRRKGYAEEWITEAMRALAEYEQQHGPVLTWWSYLSQILARVRTAHLQAESAGYKREQPNSIKAILKHLFQEVIR